MACRCASRSARATSQQQAVVLARRDRPGKEGKTFGVPVDQIATPVRALLDEIQAALLAQATAMRDANTHHAVPTMISSRRVLDGEGGFIRSTGLGRARTRRASRRKRAPACAALPLDASEGEGRCFYTGKATDQIAIFARAY